MCGEGLRVESRYPTLRKKREGWGTRTSVFQGEKTDPGPFPRRKKTDLRSRESLGCFFCLDGYFDVGCYFAMQLDRHVELT
jgi:hypothetical protein